jgi:hypothetical protein
MKHLLRRRPSAALLIAITALVVAASGTAVAATTLVSGNSLIKKNSLSGNRLQGRSVTGSKIKLSSLGTVPSAKTAATATNATNATNATTATTAATAMAAPISQVTYVSVPVTIPVTTGLAQPATATCPAGTVVTGGGASVADKTGAGVVDDSYPSGKTGWTADFEEFNADTTGAVYAICAPAAATAP